jgi:lipopolysaccharide export system permease protein
MLMPALHRYFLRQFVRYFVVLTMGLSIFFSVIHVIDQLDDLVPYHPSAAFMVFYFALVIPKYFLYLLPMATLLCTILTFAIASKKKEIIAYKASGGNIRNLLIPFIITGLLISIVDMASSEYAVPISNQTANDLIYSLKQDKKRLHLQQGDIWLRGHDGTILHADTYIPAGEFMKNVLFISVEQDRPSFAIFADEASWAQGEWILKSAKKYDFLNRRVLALKSVRISGFGDPDVLASGISTPEEMGIVALAEYRNRLEESGFKNKKLDVDILSRIIYPFTCLFMMMLGLSIALRSDVGSGLVGLATGVIVSLVYWFVYTFTLSLGFAGVIPPLASAGSAPLLFAGVSLYMIRKIPS